MNNIVPTIRPTKKQHEAYQILNDKVTSFLFFGGGAEGGKSWLGAEWLLTNCYFYPGTKWFIGRNELKRLMQSSYATFRKVCAYHGIPDKDWKLNGQYNFIEFRNPKTGKFDGNGSRIDLLDLKFQPSDPQFQRFGSTEYTGGWIDEAGEVHYLAFDVLKVRIGRWMNKEYGLNPAKILLTCNPELNWIYRIGYKPWRNGTLEEGYAFIQSLYSDNPYTREEAKKRLSKIKDKVLKARLMLGLWEYADDNNSLVDYDSIIDLFTNVLPEPEITGRPIKIPKFLTTDVARYGSDKSTFGKWRGFDLYNVESTVKRGVDQTAQKVKDILRKEMIPYSQCIADEDGIGGGVVDIVRGIKGFVGNSSPIVTDEMKRRHLQNKSNYTKINYKNLRSQCGFMLADKIVNHEICISANLDEATKEMIIEDLQQLKKKDTGNEGPLQLIPKDEIKEAIGRSPDYSDMMMMRMYFELKKPKVMRITQPTGGVQPFYNGMPG